MPYVLMVYALYPWYLVIEKLTVVLSLQQQLKLYRPLYLAAAYSGVRQD